MNRLVRGSIMVVTAAVAWACSTDLGKDADVTDHLVATPSVVLVANTDSETVDVEALNPDGQQLAADFSISDGGSGIVVRQDTSFLPVPGGHSPVRARYVVRAATPGTFVNTSFTIAANGKTITVPVSVVPVTAVASFSNATPLIGDTVTFTAPGALRFTPASTVTSSNGRVTLLAISADSTTLTLAFGPDAFNATIAVTNAVVPYIPGQTFTVTSTGTVTTPASSAFPIGINNLTPNIGDALVLTVAAPFKFTPASTPRVPTAGFFVQSRAADSSSITILIGPNADSNLVVNNIVIPALPGLGTYTLGTAGVVTSPVVANFTAGYSDNTPDINQTVTLSATGLKFLPTAIVRLANDQQTITARAADSSSVTFRVHQQHSALDSLRVDGLVFPTLVQVPLTLPADAGITISATVLTLAGTNDFPTAPLLDIPATGNLGGVINNGPFFTGPAACSSSLGGPCHIFKFVTTATRTFSIAASWNSSADLGIYRASSTFAVSNINCDRFGPAPGQFETCTLTNLAAGTYYLIVDDFSPFYPPPDDVPPSQYTMNLTGL